MHRKNTAPEQNIFLLVFFSYFNTSFQLYAEYWKFFMIRSPLNSNGVYILELGCSHVYVSYSTNTFITYLLFYFSSLAIPTLPFFLARSLSYLPCFPDLTKPHLSPHPPPLVFHKENWNSILLNSIQVYAFHK